MHGTGRELREWLCQRVWVRVTRVTVNWLRDHVAAVSLRTDTCQGSGAIDS